MNARPLVCSALIAVSTIVSVAVAAPLTMTYIVHSVGAGMYQYDFSLTLDNHDGTWSPGNPQEQWDWIMFGDNNEINNYPGFDTMVLCSL